MGRAGLLVAVTLAVGGLVAAPASAVEPYLFTFGALGGLGGPLDAGEPDPGLSNRALQLQIGLVTEDHTLLQLRLGRLELADEDRLGGFTAPELTYATLAGEYRFSRRWYESGIFLGLGGYRVRGDRGFETDDETALGATLGVTADVELNRWLSLVGELTGHYALLDEETMFATAMGGLAVRF